MAERADVRAEIRRLFETKGELTVDVARGKSAAPELAHYRDHLGRRERAMKAPSHKLKCLSPDVSGADILRSPNAVATAIAAQTGQVIVNASFAYRDARCGETELEPCGITDVSAAADVLRQDPALRTIAAIDWAIFAAQPSVQENVLLVVAGGNARDGTDAG